MNNIDQWNGSPRLRIEGRQSLQGQVVIAGSKNSALPIMAASLLTRDLLTIDNLPHLDDVALLNQLLASLGVEILLSHSNTMEFRADQVQHRVRALEEARQMRASILVLGPLLARCGQAQVPYPGGCLIGERPVDLHMKALKKMGAVFEEDNTEEVNARAPKGLHGAKIRFSRPTVGGTENVMLAACLARGTTVIEGAALEPEVTDLASCLLKMGAKITGIGTSTLEIEGVREMHGTHHRIIPDRIESGTYLVSAAATGGKIELLSTRNDTLEIVLEKLRAAGARVETDGDSILLDMQGKRPRAVDIQTAPYPGFPTDMQAQFTAMNIIAKGDSVITDNVFNHRTAHIGEMQRMGAKVNCKGNSVYVESTEKLSGATVHASDLRASASLVIAGLVAEGITEIIDIHHIDRGYQWIEEKLRLLGARVTRTTQ